MGLILNADDFGKSKDVNRAILECFEKGFIDRTTLMVNMPEAEQAVKAAREAGFADRIGIHLNLTEGTPLTVPIRSNPLFCDGSGNFNAAFRHKTLYRLFMSAKTREQVYTELSAQMQRYAEWGLTLYHIDSHHHVHTDRPIYAAIKRLAREYSFSSVRLSRNLYHGGSLLNRIYKRWFNASLRRICGSTTDYFGSCSDFVNYGTAEEKRILCQKSKVEIMLHPMYDQQGRLMDTDEPMEEVRDHLSEYLKTDA